MDAYQQFKKQALDAYKVMWVCLETLSRGSHLKPASSWSRLCRCAPITQWHSAVCRPTSVTDDDCRCLVVPEINRACSRLCLTRFWWNRHNFQSQLICILCALAQLASNIRHVQGAANKSNPLPCCVNISTTNLNFYKKIYVAISHSYLHITAKLCCIITTFD